MLPRRGLVFSSMLSALRSCPSVGWVGTLRCDSGSTFLTKELLAGQETPGKIDERFIFFFPPLKCSHTISSGRVWDVWHRVKIGSAVIFKSLYHPGSSLLQSRWRCGGNHLPSSSLCFFAGLITGTTSWSVPTNTASLI